MRARFGQFTVDSATRQLFGETREIHLSPKAFDLLCTLIARRPGVVTKEELFGRLWPDTFVVEANLNVLVGEVRRALSDDARAPRFIRTAHGVGYAFSAEAAEDAAPSTPDDASPAHAWLEGHDRTFLLVEGDNVIGRDPTCAVCLSDSSVSRRHARIRIARRDRTALLDDLQSTNGTLVNGRVVKAPARLTDGSTVRIGSVELKFRQSGATLPATRRVRSAP